MKAKETGPRLGRGLAALMGETPKSHAASIANLAIATLEPNPYQPRGPIDPASLGELVASIRANGVLQPLLARPKPGDAGRYQIVAGERRWRAAQAAGLDEIPTLVRDLSDLEVGAAALVENLQRQDLNAIEEAVAYRRLIDEFRQTQDALAETVGKSRSHIANTLRLLNLPTAVQVEVKNGALSAGHARALLTHPEPEKAALAVIAGGLNVRQTEALVAQKINPAAKPVIKERDPETIALQRDLAERLGLRVDISFDGTGGAVRIYYQSLDQLDGLITKLSQE